MCVAACYGTCVRSCCVSVEHSTVLQFGFERISSALALIARSALFQRLIHLRFGHFSLMATASGARSAYHCHHVHFVVEGKRATLGAIQGYKRLPTSSTTMVSYFPWATEKLQEELLQTLVQHLSALAQFLSFLLQFTEQHNNYNDTSRLQ